MTSLAILYRKVREEGKNRKEGRKSYYAHTVNIYAAVVILKDIRLYFFLLL